MHLQVVLIQSLPIIQEGEEVTNAKGRLLLQQGLGCPGIIAA
jgi:hypothetical protein